MPLPIMVFGVRAGTGGVGLLVLYITLGRGAGGRGVEAIGAPVRRTTTGIIVVGCLVGDALMGAAVSPGVRVGGNVGDTVGAKVGDTVGVAVATSGVMVGFVVGIKVGASVGAAVVTVSS